MLEIWSTTRIDGFLRWAAEPADVHGWEDLSKYADRVYSCRTPGAAGFYDLRVPGVRAFLEEVFPPDETRRIDRNGVSVLRSWAHDLSFSGRTCVTLVDPNCSFDAAVAAAEADQRYAKQELLRKRYGVTTAARATTPSVLTRLVHDESAILEREVFGATLKWGRYIGIWARPSGWPIFLAASLSLAETQKIGAAAQRYARVHDAASFGALPMT